MNTYGIHGIHGRAPTIATGIKMVKPELTVWVVTGDGDALSIGGNHLLHALRRNVDIKILLFNNRIYGLTKGQFSPTSELGKVTKSTPTGTIDYPLEPIRLALAAGATLVARTLDVDTKHLQETLVRAARHRGAAFVEIYQNCPIYNDGAFDPLTQRSLKAERVLYLEHGRALVYGAAGERGIALGPQLAARLIDAAAEEPLVHDEQNELLGFLLAGLESPRFPTPLGVFRAVSKPTHEQLLEQQVERAVAQRAGGLQSLLESGTTWRV
jgi:2-oxoglutarate ferredoxin oxidoreductase subunit beta